ncbi:uncharacterized protein LOC132293469 [Cornus florida]|uniref:uncharacterized protein LOC132293469 n=1 Tax=Cornus florida TaxID=4283 RepID=UPI00289DD109|nr:uncharacterized protein LOC132293469 [Cornus florida]
MTLKFEGSMKHLDRQVAQIRGKHCVEKPACEMLDQRDLDAALVLVQLANGVSYFPKDYMASSRRNYGAFQMPDGELPTTLLADDNRQDANRFRRHGKIKKVTGEKLKFSLSKTTHMDIKEKSRKVENNFSSPKSKKCRKFYFHVAEERFDSREMHGLSDSRGLTSRLGRKGWQNIESCTSDGHDRLGAKFSESTMVTKKRKAKADTTYLDGLEEYDHSKSRCKKLINVPTSLKKKLPSHKEDPETGSLDSGLIYGMLLSQRTAIDDVEPVIRSAKQQEVTFFTPTLHTGFSFSIIHLLSAVRMALVTPHAEKYALAIGKHIGEGKRRRSQCEGIRKRSPEDVTEFHSREKRGVLNSEQTKEKSLSYLTIHEILQRVRSKPGDYSILETQEPLLDLVRGVLKIFSSRAAPLGVKGWKALAMYEKSSKSWCWIGPVSSNLSPDSHIEEESSPEAWGLPQRTLVKLVDCFANWLKNRQEALQQIGSLPAPPIILMQPSNATERFNGVRVQRSLGTIRPSSDEVKAYFRREETLRYLIPDSAFCYTALDGRKSAVAPLRRCSGKPSARARDHFMLKHNRPPQVTVLCLVRDAAARLPGSIGTRADVCTLVRDSQHIVEDVTELQVKQVVSGALDRLHYERDPCVQFDKDRHLWVYLHGEREEEEFENDGTSSRLRYKQ